MSDCSPHLPPPDALLVEIASFAANPPSLNDTTIKATLDCVLDSLGVALLGLQKPDCARWLGPVVPGTNLPLGARLPGTGLELDPAKAAFDMTLCMRWLDLQCIRPGRETVSPGDLLGPVLCVADWVGRNLWHSGQFRAFGAPMASRDIPPTMRDVVSAFSRAQEIQGALAEANDWSSKGVDTGVLARVAGASVLVPLLGGTREQIVSAASLAWQAGVSPVCDPCRAPWLAASDAGHAVLLALRAMAGDPGCPRVLTKPATGFQDACHGGVSLSISLPPENSAPLRTVYNLGHPDPLAAQTVAEAAVRLHASVAQRLGEVARIEVCTHAAGLALEDSADRKRSLRRAVAVSLAHGRINEALLAAPDPLVLSLEDKVFVREEAAYTVDSRDPDKRAMPNAVQLQFAGGGHSERVSVEYPIGHYRRRTESVPLLYAKAESAIGERFGEERAEEIVDLFDSPSRLLGMSVTQFMELWTA